MHSKLQFWISGSWNYGRELREGDYVCVLSVKTFPYEPTTHEPGTKTKHGSQTGLRSFSEYEVQSDTDAWTIHISLSGIANKLATLCLFRWQVGFNLLSDTLPNVQNWFYVWLGFRGIWWRVTYLAWNFATKYVFYRVRLKKPRAPTMGYCDEIQHLRFKNLGVNPLSLTRHNLLVEIS